MSYLKKVLLSHREEFMVSTLLPLCLLVIGAVIDCVMICLWNEKAISNAFVFTALGVVFLLDFMGFAFFYFSFRLKISLGVTRNQFLLEELTYGIMAAVTGFLLLVLALMVDSGLLYLIADIPFGEAAALKDVTPFLFWIFLALLCSSLYLRFVLGGLLLRFSAYLGIFAACVWAVCVLLTRPVASFSLLEFLPVILCIVLAGLPLVSIALIKKQGI